MAGMLTRTEMSVPSLAPPITFVSLTKKVSIGSTTVSSVMLIAIMALVYKESTALMMFTYKHLFMHNLGGVYLTMIIFKF